MKDPKRYQGDRCSTISRCSGVLRGIRRPIISDGSLRDTRATSAHADENTSALAPVRKNSWKLRSRSGVRARFTKSVVPTAMEQQSPSVLMMTMG